MTVATTVMDAQMRRGFLSLKMVRIRTGMMPKQ